MIKTFLFLLFIIFWFTHASETTLLINKKAISHACIKKHNALFKEEIKAVKKFCTIAAIIGVISYGYQFSNLVRSLLSLKNNSDDEPSGIISYILKQVISLAQYALVSYILQKCISYGIRYYLYEHPISWLLNHKTPVRRHFDILFQSIDIMAKKHKNQNLAPSLKNSILLFIENIIRDIEQICAFIDYRAESLPAYKLSTVTLIKEEIITITHTWTHQIEKEITKKNIDPTILYNFTHQFKLLLFEQIELFKKIDDEIEFLRSLCMLTEVA